jgi:hypothetical protein
VAIRDGKLATETVRQAAANGGLNGDYGTAEEEEIYEELVVLDSAGRLQIPKEYLEYFEITGRARLEMAEDGILIRPAPHATSQDAETAASSLAPAARGGGRFTSFGGRVRNLFRGRGQK